MKGECPLIALAINKDDNKESLFIYKENEKFFNTASEDDLFFTPIKKEGWVNIYQDPNEYPKTGNIYETKEEAIIKKDNINYKATIKIEWEE